VKQAFLKGIFQFEISNIFYKTFNRLFKRPCGRTRIFNTVFNTPEEPVCNSRPAGLALVYGDDVPLRTPAALQLLIF